MLWIELIIFLAIIVIGARIGGIGMGTVAGLGLIVFYGTVIAAVNFGQTGTTHKGKYLVNHSFMHP